jgi:AraC-like DNA-binding protein
MMARQRHRRLVIDGREHDGILARHGTSRGSTEQPIDYVERKPLKLRDPAHHARSPAGSRCSCREKQGIPAYSSTPFRAFLGKTPQDVLQDMRFERARRDLLRASSNATVTDIAAHCGFIHLGRFSVEYHKRYGEKPSETLHRRGTFLAERATKRSCLGVTAHDSATIALTPIKSQEGDEALACGVADEIAMALMRAGLALTSRPEMARYHLRCTLRGVQREVRLTSRLIDAATGRHLWAHCHEGTIQDAFFFEESAAMSMAAAMRPSLRTAEIEQAWRKPDVDLTANDLTLRALPFALALSAQRG